MINTDINIGIIHQPHFLPWLGYYNKLANSDVFIVQDDVQYRKRYFQNRTLIQNSQKKPIWFTIPVHSKRITVIQDVKIADKLWNARLIKILKYSYGQEEYFKENIDFIESIILNNKFIYLSDLNTHLIEQTSKYLNISFETVNASKFEHRNNPSEELIYLCKKKDVNMYVFGEGGGQIYHGISMFKKAGISTIQQKFIERFIKINNNIYPNNYQMSLIHYLFLIGRSNTERIIKETWKINE